MIAAPSCSAMRSPSGGASEKAWNVPIFGTPGVSQAVQYEIAGTGGSWMWTTSNVFSLKKRRSSAGDASSAIRLSDPFDAKFTMPPMPTISGSSVAALEAPKIVTRCP